MRSTAGSSSSPSRDDWLATSRAILPSAQSEKPLNVSTATAHPVGVGDQQQVQEDPRNQHQAQHAQRVGHRQHPIARRRVVHGLNLVGILQRVPDGPWIPGGWSPSHNSDGPVVSVGRAKLRSRWPGTPHSASASTSSRATGCAGPTRRAARFAFSNAFGWSARPSLSAAPTRVCWVGVDGACRRSIAATAVGREVAPLTMRPAWLLGCANSNTSQEAVPQEEDRATAARLLAGLPRHRNHVRNIRRHFLHQVSGELVKTPTGYPRRPQRVRDASQPPARTSCHRRRLGEFALQCAARPTGAPAGRLRRTLVPSSPDLLLRSPHRGSGVPSLTHWLRISVCSSSTVAPTRSGNVVIFYTVDEIERRARDIVARIDADVMDCDPALADTEAFCAHYGVPPGGVGQRHPGRLGGDGAARLRRLRPARHDPADVNQTVRQKPGSGGRRSPGRRIPPAHQG